MSLFTMPLEEGMADEARRYFTLRQQEEIHCLERRMRMERRAAELEKLEHKKLLKVGNLQASSSRIRAALVVPVDTPAPAWAPSPTNADSGAAGAGETPRDLPVFTCTRLLCLIVFLIVMGLWVVCWELGGVRRIAPKYN